MNELDVARHSRFVDPQLHVWGWEIPVYLFLGGLAAGAMVLSAILAGRPGERSRAARWLTFAAPLLVSLGMGALYLDLANKLHVFRFYLAFRWTSPMSWGAWILLVVYPVTLLAGLAALTDAEAEAVAGRAGPLARPLRAARAFALARAVPLRRWSIGTGVALGVYTGILLSTLGARALWGSALLGPLFLVSGLSTGAAFMMFFRVAPDERHLLARWDLAFIGVEALLLALLLIGLASGGAAGHGAAALLLGGPFTGPFFALVVLAGLAVPAALEVLELRLHLPPTFAAPALVLVGGLSLRWILVVAGQL
jgi:formate-dependent nitrite reductase membrane component NrfD